MKIALSTYAAIAILTFGSAYHHNPDGPSAIATAGEMNTMRAGGCALMWPLYWSYRLFEP